MLMPMGPVVTQNKIKIIVNQLDKKNEVLVCSLTLQTHSINITTSKVYRLKWADDEKERTNCSQLSKKNDQTMRCEQIKTKK